MLISSGDKDLAQLVGEGVVLEDSMQEKCYDPDAVVAKFGVGPERVGDLLALTGDTSDNIPGRREGWAEDRGQVAEPSTAAWMP